ncbi:MAG: restriction endonuclease subunit S [Bdellovibrionales bacterium]|nr:restriction endonuclease subunit S [Bdellovibrionales bacterium]
MKRFEVFPGDLLISCSGTMGKIAIIPEKHKKGIINQALLKLTPHKNKLSGKYLQLILQSNFIQNKYFKNQAGSSIENVSSVKKLKQIKIPLPSFEVQKEIVEEIEKETEYIEACKELIQININKTQQKINEIWNEKEKNCQ